MRREELAEEVIEVEEERGARGGSTRNTGGRGDAGGLIASMGDDSLLQRNILAEDDVRSDMSPTYL